MDTRIGYPNEHLAGNSDSETTSPLYATAVGLVLNSLEQKERTGTNDTTEQADALEDVPPAIETAKDNQEPETARQEPKKFFDKWAEKFKEFLDNAE
jgi:cell division protein FtsA